MTSQSGSHRPRWWRVVWASFAVPPLMGLAYYIGTPESRRWLWSEQGPLELSEVFIPLIAMGLGLATLATKGRIAAIRRAGLGWLAAAILGLALLCGVIAGEEASWGQHLLGWSTPESWSELNDQHETNLHNIGSWADQKPRAIVELGVILFGIIWPLSDRLGSVRVPQSWRLIMPPATVFPIALFAEAVRFLERGPKLVGLPRLAAFPRPSELQEFYFYMFFAICIVAWRQRLLFALAQAHEVETVTQPEPVESATRKRAA